MYFIKLRNRKTKQEKYILHYDIFKNKICWCKKKSEAQCYLSTNTLLEQIDYLLNNNPNILGEFYELIIETGV